MVQAYKDTLSFFHDKIKKILSQRKEHIHESTEFYIVNLLSVLTKLEPKPQHQAFSQDIPLALLYANACDAKNKHEKYKHFKMLGDHALFVSGIFSDSLKEKVVDIDYYIGMGSNAYQALTKMSSHQEFITIFDELSIKFHFFVDLLSEVSEEFQTTSNDDLLRLYDRWLNTKSQRLLKKLKEKGLDPNQVPNEKKYH